MELKQWNRLDGLAEKLKANYEGKLKGTQPMIKSAMRIAYAKGVTDTIQTIIDQEMDMARLPELPTPAQAEEPTP